MRKTGEAVKRKSILNVVTENDLTKVEAEFLAMNDEDLEKIKKDYRKMMLGILELCDKNLDPKIKAFRSTKPVKLSQNYKLELVKSDRELKIKYTPTNKRKSYVGLEFVLKLP